MYHFNEPAFECLLGAGVASSLVCNAGNAFSQLNEFAGNSGKWLFGHLGYDLKNETEALYSHNPDQVGFPDLHFFEPELVIRLSEKEVVIYAADPATVLKEISEQSTESILPLQEKAVIKSRFSRQEYTDTVQQLQQHILRGDCYEINFCQEFYAEEILIDPAVVYSELTTVSPNPFSAFYKYQDKFCICASPERYLKKQGTHIFSQPIKGTARRDRDNIENDQAVIKALRSSSKERSENVMVVDLVRNDLSRICEEGTVKVDELFGVYSFPQVHQLISTVSGEIKEGLGIAAMIRASFPMGSMTGAPKKKVMELIEEYERTKRGLFSGAIGYIDPNGDFDFNVVIRSILYDQSSQYLSFQTGSAITFYSDPEQEYEECLLKAKAILGVLEQD